MKKTTTRSSYHLRTAVSDANKAILANPYAFLTAFICGFLAAIFTTAVGMMLLSFAGATILNLGVLQTLDPYSVLTVVAICLYLTGALVLAVANSFLISSLSLALHMPPSQRVRLSEFLLSSLRKSGRVIQASMLFVIVAVWPVLLLAFFASASLVSALSADGGWASYALLLLAGAVAWAIIVGFRFVLAPYVALFEPTVRIEKTLRRSSQLLGRPGQLFVGKIAAIVILLLILLSQLTGMNLQELFFADNTALQTLWIVLIVLGNAVLYRLYVYYAHTNKR